MFKEGKRKEDLTYMLVVGLRHAFPRHVARTGRPDDVGAGAQPADVRCRHGAANCDDDHNRCNLEDRQESKVCGNQSGCCSCC